LDLAAGTGKLTRGLVTTGARVVAVEPLGPMRALLERAVPEAEALEGTAEAIPLADGAVDAATVAQAFHWFDLDRAYRELHRVLRPGGGLAIVWNTRDSSNPLQRALTSLLRAIPAASTVSHDYDAPARAELFGEWEVWRHPWADAYDRDRLLTR